MSSPAGTLLVFGATGNTGKYILTHALAAGCWRVVAFVRNPARIPEEVRDKVTIVQGDLNDNAAVAEAVKQHKPTSVIDASSTLPTNPKGRPQNNADRAKFVRTVYDALSSEGRISQCSLVILGGVVLPEPGGSVPGCMPSTINCLVRCCVPSLYTQFTELMAWMWTKSDPAFSFIYVRAGHIVQEPSRGVLVPEGTGGSGAGPRSKASFTDMAQALVSLAGSEGKPWARKALYLNYAPAGTGAAK